MKLFLDTADVEEVRAAATLGVVSGVTTNPSLAAKAGAGGMEAYKAAVQQIADIVDGPISIEVVSETPEGMVAQGRDFANWVPDPWIKLPSNAAGFQAMSVLAGEGHRINQTLCFSVNQALLGAQAGAHAVSPFVGRMDDIGQRGMDLVRDIVDVFSKHGIETLALAASIRHTLHVVEAARAGAHVATVPYAVLKQMIGHPLTTAGVERFQQDWRDAIRK